MQFQIILSGKNKKYNKLSAVELAIGKFIQLYLVGVGEFLVCMQFSAKKKKKKRKEKEKKKQILIRRCILCHLLN